MYFSEWLFFANGRVHSKWQGGTQISTVGPETFYSTGTDHTPISQHTSHLRPHPSCEVSKNLLSCMCWWMILWDGTHRIFMNRFSLSCLRRYLLKRSKKNKVSERRSMLRNFLPSWFYICGVSLIVPKSQFPHLLNGVNYFCPICIIEKLWKCEGIIEWYGFENQFMS